MKIIISKKKDGAMNLSENRNVFFQKNNLDLSSAIFADLSHGKEVKIVNKEDRGNVMEDTDGLITSSREIILGVTVADCLPLFLFSRKIIGVLHAGWKGIERGIIEEAFKKVEEIGESKENLRFYVGPGIDSCHYEVKKDVLKKFEDFNSFFQEKNGKFFLPLKEIAREKIRKNGVKNIKISPICTYCDKDYFSFRRDKKVNKMLALITK